MKYSSIGNYNVAMANAIRSSSESELLIQEQVHLAKKIPSELHQLAKEKGWENESVLSTLKDFVKKEQGEV